MGLCVSVSGLCGRQVVCWNNAAGVFSNAPMFCVFLVAWLQVGGVFIRVFNQRGRSSANATNATVTAATTTAAAASGPLSSSSQQQPGPLSQQQPGPQQQRGGPGVSSSSSSGGVQPSDPSGFCKALVRYLYDRLVERCFRGAELQQLSAGEARDVLDVVTALAGESESVRKCGVCGVESVRQCEKGVGVMQGMRSKRGTGW